MNDHRDEPIPRLFSLMARFTGGVEFDELATADGGSGSSGSSASSSAGRERDRGARPERRPGQPRQASGTKSPNATTKTTCSAM